MTPSSQDAPASIAGMHDLLRDSRRRLFHQALLQGLLRAVDRSLLVLVVYALGWLSLRLAGRILATASPSETWVIAGAGLLVLVLFAVEIAGVLRRQPGFTESAERLDLATADHNRIATALSLLEAADPSPFARAATREGVEYLHRLSREKPSVDRVRWSGRRNAVLVVSILVAAAMAIWIGPSGSAKPTEPEATSPMAHTPLVLASGAAPANPDSVASRPPTPPTREASRAPRTTGDAGSAAQRERTASGERTSGLAGGTAPAQARQSQQFTDSRGGGTDAASSSRDPEEKRPGASQARKPRDARPLGERKQSGAEESSAVRGGSSGGGGMFAVHNPWSQKAQSTGGDQDEDEGDEEVEDEAQSSSQRGGIQPSLKDRNQSPSRELGISEGQGPPGSGRGGPTPPKKSRGTASLVLGVPVPDFVKGRLAPGTTKVTHERVDPAQMPGARAELAVAAPRSLAESPVSRYTVPPGFARFVREYLIALHSADREVSNSASASSLNKEESK
jgi:hypothetical protein